MRKLSLQRREWLDALNAAMILAQEQHEQGKPFPLDKLHFAALDTWGGVVGNLMAICNHFREEDREEEE